MARKSKKNRTKTRKRSGKVGRGVSKELSRELSTGTDCPVTGGRHDVHINKEHGFFECVACGLAERIVR